MVIYKTKGQLKHFELLLRIERGRKDAHLRIVSPWQHQITRENTLIKKREKILDIDLFTMP